jgi:ELWxxDGT repeat protein
MRPKVASSRRQARSTPAFILDCEPRCYLAATLVADINTRPVPDFLPTEVFSTGDLAYFFKNDGVHGTELWRTDGTTAGTALFKDIYPGPGSSSAGASAPSFSRAPDGTVYFGASDGVSGAELWKTDGTAAGTLMVTDVRPGAGNQYGQPLAFAGGAAYFGGTDGTTGGLWKTTGAPGDLTRLATNSALNAPFQKLTAFDNRVFVNDLNRALWTSDGTVAGTRIIQTSTSSFGSFEVTPDALFYTRLSAVYRIARGSTIPTAITGVAANVSNITSVSNGDIYYGATGGSGATVYRIPAGTTAASAHQVLGFAAANAAPTNFKGVGADLYFSTGSQTAGYTLWARRAVDGFVSSVTQLNPGGTGVQAPALFTPLAGKLLFLNDAPVTRQELWTSDGTAQNTALLRDVNPGSADSTPFYFGTIGDRVIFQATHATYGPELWATRPGEAPTLLADTNPSNVGVQPGSLAVLGDRGFFRAGDPSTTGAELWVTDGTPAGTALLKDIVPGATGSNPFYLTTFNGRVYFAADDGVRGEELWSTDGTAEGTTLVADIHPTGSSSPRDLIAANGRLYFVADSADYGEELWVTDGTAASTRLVKDVDTRFGVGSDPTRLTPFKGALYFVAKTFDTGAELWRTDGTPAGTSLVKDINGTSAASSVGDLLPAGDYLAFAANDGTTGREIWRTDGTPAGTVRLTDVLPGTASSTNGFVAPLGEHVVWYLPEASGGMQLWDTNVTTGASRLLKQIYPAGTFAQLAGRMASGGGQVFFAADNGATGLELWRTDGTPEGTGMVEDLAPGATSGVRPDVAPFLAPDGSVYVMGNNGVYGYEPYRFTDTFAPRLAAAAFDKATGRGARLTFTEDLTAPSPAQLRVTNLDTKQDLPSTAFQVAYDPATRTLTVTLTPAAPNTPVPDGNYRLTLTTATDPAGNALAAPVTYDFFALAGDANHDRAVNFDDLLVLAKNYNTTKTTFPDGDFTGDHLVNFDDLLILAKNYNKTLPQPAAPASPVTAVPLSAAALLAAITPATPTLQPPPTPPKRPAPPIFSTKKLPPPAPQKKTAPPGKPAVSRSK